MLEGGFMLRDEIGEGGRSYIMKDLCVKFKGLNFI